MYFVIDYENVHYSGLEGTEFLKKEDTVSFFYGPGSGKILGYRLQDILNSQCQFEICKLKRGGHNALDFYIASKIGEIFNADITKKVAIISNDKGFQAVVDYWSDRLCCTNQLCRSTSIAKGILGICGEEERKEKINRWLKTLDLELEHKKYELKNQYKESIKKVLEENNVTDIDVLGEKLFTLISEGPAPKELYLNVLKICGRTVGLEVYRAVKKDQQVLNVCSVC